MIYVDSYEYVCNRNAWDMRKKCRTRNKGCGECGIKQVCQHKVYSAFPLFSRVLFFALFSFLFIFFPTMNAAGDSLMNLAVQAVAKEVGRRCCNRTTSYIEKVLNLYMWNR